LGETLVGSASYLVKVARDNPAILLGQSAVAPVKAEHSGGFSFAALIDESMKPE
jgi:hypothetical protein